MLCSTNDLCFLKFFNSRLSRSSLFSAVIFYICQDFGLDFNAMYCAVGLWNSFFLILYSLFDVSRLMRWSTRSTEEIFALFISIAFCNDAFSDVIKSEYIYYYVEQGIKSAVINM